MEKELKLLNEILDKDIEKLNSIKKEEKGRIVLEILETFLKNDVKKVYCENPRRITIPLDKKDVVKYTLNFYKDLDPDMYQIARKILINLLNSNILISLYDKKGKDDILEDPDFPKYVDGSQLLTIYADIITNDNIKIPRMQTKQGKIYVGLEGTPHDIYVLVHEIAHTFNYNPNSSKYRFNTNIFDEVNPRLMELFLSDFLIKEGVVTEKDTLLRKIFEYNDNVEDARITHLRIELAKLKEKKGIVDKEDIKDALKNNDYKVKIDEQNTDIVLRKLIGYNKAFNADYVIADLLKKYIYDLCKKQPEKRKEIINAFTNGLHEDDIEKTFNAIGLKADKESISKLIDLKIQDGIRLQKQIDDLSFQR